MEVKSSGVSLCMRTYQLIINRTLVGRLACLCAFCVAALLAALDIIEGGSHAGQALPLQNHKNFLGEHYGNPHTI